MLEENTEGNNEDDDTISMAPVFALTCVANTILFVVNAAAGNKVLTVTTGIAALFSGIAAIGSPNEPDFNKLDQSNKRKSSYLSHLPKNGPT